MSFTLSTVRQAAPQVIVATNAIKVAAFAANIDFKAVEVSVTEVFKLNAFGVLPVLTTESGSFAGLQAIKAVQQCGSLTGRCPNMKSQIDQYLQIVPLITEQTVAFKALEDGKASDNDKINALNKLMAFVKPLNETLVASTFLLGNTFTIADIAVAVALKDIFARYMGPKKRSEVPALTRWFNTVMGQKCAAKVFGAEINIQAKDVCLMPDLLAVAAKPEVKKDDPIAKMARSAMHLDTIKKLYCMARPYNVDFGTEFWPQFDAEGYQLFQVDFKYPEDFPVEKKLFMCENGINGFITRGESAKKNVFIVLNIFENNGCFNVKGAGIVRGNREIDGAREIPFALADVSDAEEYSFTYIDSSTDEGKAKFLAAFCAPDMEGKEILNRVHLK